MDRRLNQACRPSATPSSRSLLNCHRNDARTVENGLVSRSGVSKSAKVVLVNYAHLCGRTLARAHARSADPAVLAGYMGKSSVFDDALASFAIAYADRTQSDYDKLAKSKRGTGKKL